MDIVNAIAKVRFASAKPQRIQLHKSDSLVAELLCFEPGQNLKVDGGPSCYYVVTGTAVIDGGGGAGELPAGQFATAAKDESHAIANAGEQRLVCLTVRTIG